MVQLMDNLLIGLQIRAVKAKEKFEDESGVSSFVATILLIVIVVALMAIFWDKISEWFNDTWDTITGNADKVGVSGASE